jgi:hypothetical protein
MFCYWQLNENFELFIRLVNQSQIVFFASFCHRTIRYVNMIFTEIELMTNVSTNVPLESKSDKLTNRCHTCSEHVEVELVLAVFHLYGYSRTCHIRSSNFLHFSWLVVYGYGNTFIEHRNVEQMIARQRMIKIILLIVCIIVDCWWSIFNQGCTEIMSEESERVCLYLSSTTTVDVKIEIKFIFLTIIHFVTHMIEQILFLFYRKKILWHLLHEFNLVNNIIMRKSKWSY